MSFVQQAAEGVVDLKPDAFYSAAYLLVSACLLCLALYGDGWWPLIWPSLSFLIVSFAYATGSVGLLGKREDGRRSAWHSVVLCPYLISARIVWELRTRLIHEPAWQPVDGPLIIARRLRAGELPEKISALIDLTSEFADPRVVRTRGGYRCFPMLDANTLLPASLAAAVRSVPPPPEGCLVIHCAYGHGRAAVFAAAWMICHGLAENPDDALVQLQSVRPGISLRRCQREALEDAGRIFVSAVGNEGQHRTGQYVS